jgi:hypothetical protein
MLLTIDIDQCLRDEHILGSILVSLGCIFNCTMPDPGVFVQFLLFRWSRTSFEHRYAVASLFLQYSMGSHQEGSREVQFLHRGAKDLETVRIVYIQGLMNAF